MKDTSRAHPHIRLAITDLEAAKKHYSKRVLDAQGRCLHYEVLESPHYRIIKDGMPFQSQRVCRMCGLMEWGGYGSRTTYSLGGDWINTGDPSYWGTNVGSKLATEFARPATTEEVRSFICQPLK